jgi:Rrf2 family protein
MWISKKCQYALRSVFELAVRNTDQPIKIQQLALAQGIPPRFLELILNQLRHAGFVESRRGSEGGYMLAQDAAEITVGEVIRCIQGPILLSDDYEGSYKGDSAFCHLWQDINSAVEDICDKTTFSGLIESERAARAVSHLDYAI